METGLGSSRLLHAVVVPPNYKKQYLFEGFVKSVSSFNVEGAFDVLPMHENFVSMVRDKVVIVDDKDLRHEFVLGKGIIEATNNNVRVIMEF